MTTELKMFDKLTLYVLPVRKKTSSKYFHCTKQPTEKYYLPKHSSWTPKSFLTAYQFSVQQETKNRQTMEIQFSSHPCLRHLREKDYQIQQSCYTKATALRPYNCLILLTIVAWHECLRIKRKHLRLIEISYAGMWCQAGETAELNLKHCTLLSPDTHTLWTWIKGGIFCWGQSDRANIN